MDNSKTPLLPGKSPGEKFSIQVQDDGEIEDAREAIGETEAYGNRRDSREFEIPHVPYPRKVIRNGVSIENKDISVMMENSKRLVVLAVTIINHTEFLLKKKRIFQQNGKLRRGQHNVEPQTAEVFIALNTMCSLTGTKGIASYLVKGLGVYLNIFWSVPITSSKYLGIEVTHVKPTGQTDFDRLEKLKPNKETENGIRMDCVVGLFKTDLETREVEYQNLRVTCTMGNDNKTEAVIDVYHA